MKPMPSKGTHELGDTFSVWAWLIAPSLRGKPERIHPLIANLQGIASSFNLQLVNSDEPCFYRTTAEGFQLLAEAIRSESVSGITMGTALDGSVERSDAGGDNTSISMECDFFRRFGVQLLVEIQVDRYEKAVESIDIVSGAIRSIFSELDAYYACASASLVPLTRSLSEMDFYYPETMLQHFAPTAYWGNALGTRICDTLGGQRNVLRDAPAQIKYPLGSGAWLQVAPDITVSQSMVQELADYFHERFQNLGGVDIVRANDREVRPLNQYNATVYQRLSETRTHLFDVQVTYLEERDDALLALNLHLGRRAEARDIELICRAVITWYTELNQRTPAGSRYINLSDIAVTGSILRWQAEWRGAVQIDEAVSLLERYLSSLPDVDILYLTVGVEIVG